MALTLALSGGPIHLSPRVSIDLHTMLLGATLATLGYSAIQLGTLARVFYNFNPRRRRRLAERFTYNRGMLAAISLVAVGVVMNFCLLIKWLQGGLRLAQVSYMGLLGLLLIILGFQTFVFTLLFQMINARHERPQA
jgi:hypothetical protein